MKTSRLLIFMTTVFVDMRLWKTNTRQNFRHYCVLSTDRIKIHQSQPLVWPSDLLYVMLAGCDWWISIRSVDERLTEILETFLQVFCFAKSCICINENGGIFMWYRYMESWSLLRRVGFEIISGCGPQHRSWGTAVFSKFLIRQFVSLNKTKMICSVASVVWRSRMWFVTSQ